jgi:hypothetical protein
MKNVITLLIGLFVGFTSYSQDNLFVLHPLVGDTISQAEKIEFVLFPEINNEDFLSGTLTYSAEGYFLHYQTPGNAITTKQISDLDINQYRINLGKLDEYYSNLSKNDSTKSKVKSLVEIKSEQEGKLNKDLINDETKNKIVKEAIMDARMKEDAEQLNQIKKGNDITGGGYIELFGKKKKKK